MSFCFSIEMEKCMKFDYNSRIVEQLGAELITSAEMAISELMKNSYREKVAWNCKSDVKPHKIIGRWKN